MNIHVFLLTFLLSRYLKVNQRNSLSALNIAHGPTFPILSQAP